MPLPHITTIRYDFATMKRENHGKVEWAERTTDVLAPWIQDLVVIQKPTKNLAASKFRGKLSPGSLNYPCPPYFSYNMHEI